MVSLVGVILIGKDARVVQTARRSNVWGMSISSGVMFSCLMRVRMRSILRWRGIESEVAATDAFAELDDVIFIIELFGVVDFFDADFVFTDVYADGFSGAIEVGGAVFDGEPAFRREGVFVFLQFGEEAFYLALGVDGGDAGGVVTPEGAVGGAYLVFFEEVMGVWGGVADFFCYFREGEAPRWGVGEGGAAA